MINITRQQAETITRRALDWLEANPDKHIRGEPAQNKYGMGCDPLAPSATCFCAIGRIAKEADLEGVANHRPLETAKRVLEEIRVSDNYVWSMNDVSDLPLSENLKYVRGYIENTIALDPTAEDYLMKRSEAYLSVSRKQAASARAAGRERERAASFNWHSGQGV